MSSLPYLSSPGNIDKALAGIKAAAVPERVSQDFVKHVLKIPGGSGDQMTAFLKKLGFSRADGTPTDTYTKFRNSTTSGRAMATAIRLTYARLYVRNEYMQNLSDKELLGLIVEETGDAQDSLAVKRTLSTISTLKKHADFVDSGDLHEVPDERPSESSTVRLPGYENPREASPSGAIGLNLGYTININLPATTDQAVFNAIFKSLKDHLLRADDA